MARLIWLFQQQPSPKEVLADRLRTINSQGLFDNIVVKQYCWTDTYTSDDYISLLNTHSKHRQLPEEIRINLFKSIKDLIDASGGLIDKQQMVALFLGEKSEI